MPKRKCQSENIEGQSSYYKRRSLLNEPLTLHIMREMNVLPLDNRLIEECTYDSSVSQKGISQTLVGKKRQSEFTTPEGSPSFKAIRDGFVVFRKSSHAELKGVDHFSKLSDEILLHIFHWLPKPVLVKFSQVCKRWKEISYDQCLWRRFDFGRKLVKPGVLGTLLDRGVSVLRLAMSEIKTPVFTDEFFNGQRFSKLQYLDLSMATVSQESLASLLFVCNMLKKLSLEHCPLNEDCCRYIAQNKDLVVLNMVMCQGLTPGGLNAIVTNCVQLEEWNLAWTNLDSSCMKAFLPMLPASLTRLNIRGHRDTFDDNALLTVVLRCPNLVELDISDSPLLTESSFIPLLQNCSNLQHLHTSRSYSIPTHCNRLLKDLPNFKKLEIFRTLKDEALNDLRAYMPEIEFNRNVFSTIARPTTGIRRTSIWGLRVRD